MLHLCGPETVVFHLPLELRHGVCAAVTRHAFKTRQLQKALPLPRLKTMEPHLPRCIMKTELQHLVGQFKDVFFTQPGRTNVIHHEVRTPPGTIVRQRPYRIPEARRHAIEEEVQEMLSGSQTEDGLLHSQRSLAIPGSPLRPARGPSDLSANDGHPPAAPSVLRRCLHRRCGNPLGDLGGPFRAAPEGASGAPAGWTDRQPPQVSPGSCRTQYLGFQVGRGLIKPQEKKVTAILTAPRPTTKTQVRAFLGLAGYYRCFIPNFSSLATPLTDLTRKGQPERIPWGPTEEEAFNRVKEALTSKPILRALDLT
ncbi:hypothetical protein QQF64_016301 [Cirrhinus molitorella]|uniref:Reverse transcriptase/retrotransposon-derived protein RNase H-like domain-containing protein n=1 Tax=Cirrhinus molitorella TaxID=172907 RepID=A0ABR3LME9_9TELE